jgi:hypothetical protein
MQEKKIQTMREARRLYVFHCKRNCGHVLEDKATGHLELWRADPKAAEGIRWRRTVLRRVARYSYTHKIP